MIILIQTSQWFPRSGNQKEGRRGQKLTVTQQSVTHGKLFHSLKANQGLGHFS